MNSHMIALKSAVLCFLFFIPAQFPVSAADAPVRTWDTLKLRQLLADPNGVGISMEAWSRQDHDGDEQWVTRNTVEMWAIKPYIVIYANRIGFNNREASNRFVIMMSFLTNSIMKFEKYSNDEIGNFLVNLSKEAAATPDKDAIKEFGPYLLTLHKKESVNLWLYSVEPR